MNNDKSWKQIARYFAGELSPEESKNIELWIKSDSDREKEIMRLYKVWKESEHLPYKIDVDKAWAKLSGEMDEIEKNRAGENSHLSSIGAHSKLPADGLNDKNIRREGAMWRRFLLVAATILIVSLAGFFSFYTERQTDETKSPKVENQVFITENGERATYILSDGSKVILHAGSRLEIPDNYNMNERELFLEGEAYFEVTHNEDKPFIVQSKHTYTRVLGTRFLVQAWPEEGTKVEVVVSDGKVVCGDRLVSNSDTVKEVLLTKNQMGILANGEEPVVTEVEDMDWYTGWTEGRLEFENRPLSEVLPRLERWYNIDIYVEDERIHDQKITAKIDYSQSMSEVLEGIALTLELEVNKEGRTYTFSSTD